MLSTHEAAALECCKANLSKVDPEAGPLSYIASSALYDFLGGTKSGYHLVKLISGDHHWIANEHGVILDPTRELLEAKPNYSAGKRTQKRNTMVKHLPLLEAMRESVPDSAAALARDVFGRPLIVESGAVLTDAQEEMLTSAWRALIAGWAERPEEFIRCYFSKGALAVYFARALLYGEEIPRTATMAYTWDRYYVAGSAYPFNEMLPLAAENPKLLRGIRFGLNGETSFSKLIASNLPIGGYRMPFDFPISLARDLINRYCPVEGRVLDPCHGWGGRIVGFMLSHASRYTGIDPAPHSPRVREMFDDLSVYLPEPKDARLINKPFEDTVLSDASYDFALTSPPYFNTEKYKGEQSSWRRYSTLEAWIDGFYRQMIVGVADALKPGAFFCLQVSPKFDLVGEAKRIASEAGLEFQHVADTNMKRYNSASADKGGATDLFEVVAVFRKK